MTEGRRLVPDRTNTPRPRSRLFCFRRQVASFVLEGGTVTINDLRPNGGNPTYTPRANKEEPAFRFIACVTFSSNHFLSDPNHPAAVSRNLSRSTFNWASDGSWMYIICPAS